MDHDDDFRWDSEAATPRADARADADCQPPCRAGWQDDWLPFAKKSAAGIGIIALAVALWAGGSWLVRAAGPQDIRIELQGSGVAILKPDARVVLGSTQVGQVEKVADSAGESVAVVRLNKDFVSQIPQASRFEVDSLNDWLPGNVGVRVFPTATDTHPPMVDGSRVQTSARALPPWVPAGFYIVLAGIVVVLAGVVVVAWLMRRVIVLVVAAAVIAGVIVYLNGIISPA